MSQQKKESDPKSPQERAGEHLRKLLRNAAVGGAALGLSSGCGSCGPMVCDPLPAPICDTNPTTQTFLDDWRLDSSAQWQARDGGGLAVHVSLTLYNEGEDIQFVADPAVSGGTAEGIARDARTLSFEVAPDSGVSQVEVVVELSCASKPEALKLGLDVSSPEAGAQVAISSLE